MVLNKKFFRSKFPVVRQYDQIDCGPASLLSILKYYGGDASFVNIRELCETDVQGSNMLGIVNAAKQIGFDAYGASGDYNELMKEKMPCIAHVILEDRLNHFIVIYKITEKYLLIGDPGKGRYKLSKEKFLNIWKKKAVILLKPQNGLPKTETPHWISWISQYLKKQEAWIIQSIFLGIIYTFLGLLTAIFVQSLIDKFIPEKEFNKIVYTGLFLLFILLLRATAGYLRGRFLIILNKQVSLNVTGDFLTHLFNLPKQFFDSRKTGDITARINDSLKIHQAILLFTNSTIIDGLIIIGSLAFVFYFSSFLGAITLILIPIYAILLFSKSRKIKYEQNEVMKNHALVESTYINSIQGINEIIGFNVSKSFSALNKIIFDIFQKKIEKLGFTRNSLSYVAELSGALLIVSVLTVGALWVVRGNILLGKLMASYSLLSNILPSIGNMVGAYISIQGAHIAAKRLMDLLLVEQEKNTGDKSFIMKKCLKVENASFAYPKGKFLFENFNLKIEKGKLTSLWGPSGIGKSTLVQLIERKYFLNKGNIYIDDHPVESFDLQQYRKSIGVVPQKIQIFNGTLIENILIGREAADINEVIKKLSNMGLIDFINKFEYGLMTLLGEEGRKLSGGETQLLGLARALYDKPEILIIDEGFSSIDIEIETMIYKIIKDYAKTYAVLMITHDLNRILRTDFVYIFSQDGITEKGIPKYLLENNAGYFSKLYKNQSLLNYSYGKQNEL